MNIQCFHLVEKDDMLPACSVGEKRPDWWLSQCLICWYAILSFQSQNQEEGKLIPGMKDTLEVLFLSLSSAYKISHLFTWRNLYLLVLHIGPYLC